MLYIALGILLLAAAACLGLNRTLATRWIGFAAALLTLIAGVLLAIEPLTNLTPPPLELLALGDLTFALNGMLTTLERVLGVTLLGGGAIAFFGLSTSIAPAVRGFAGIFTWALLALGAALLSLTVPPFSLFTPLTWSIASIAGYSAVRASGALNRSENLPHGLIFGLLASSLLLGSLLYLQPVLAEASLPSSLLVAGLFLAVLILAGAAPFTSARNEANAAPAALGTLFTSLIMPVLAVGFLLRTIALLPALPATWTITLGAVGALGLLTSAASALSAQGLRALLGWLSAAQLSAILISLSLPGELADLASLILLVSLMLSSTAGASAATVLELSTGSDAFVDIAPGPKLRPAGILWLLAGLSALGLPPFFGFWGWRWLLEAALTELPWTIPFILMGLVLLALAVLLPLARFWPGVESRQLPATTGWRDLAGGIVSLLPLLVLGAWPQYAWQLWLQSAAPSVDALPVSQSGQIGAIVFGILALFFGWLIARTPSARQQSQVSAQDEITHLGPDALVKSLTPLTWLSNLEGLLRRIWQAAQWSSRGLAFVMGIFEQRYYLLGVLGALITVILLMAQ